MKHFSQLLWRWTYAAMKRLLSILVLVSILFAAVAPAAFAEGPSGDKKYQIPGAQSNPDDNGKGPERNDNDPGAVDADDTSSKPNGKNDNGSGNESDGDCDDNEGNCKAHQPKDAEATNKPAPLVTPDATLETTSTDQLQGVVTPTATPTVIATAAVTETIVVTDVHTVTETVIVINTVEPQLGGRMVAAPLTSNWPTCSEQRTTCCPQVDYTNTNWLAAVILSVGLVVNGLLRRGRLS